jgi:hypothetical protein
VPSLLCLFRVVDVGAKEVDAVKPLLRDMPDIIVGTPGRLAQHLKYVFTNFLDPDSIRSSDLDSESGSGSRNAKMSTPLQKKKIMF